MPATPSTESGVIGFEVDGWGAVSIPRPCVSRLGSVLDRGIDCLCGLVGTDRVEVGTGAASVPLSAICSRTFGRRAGGGAEEGMTGGATSGGDMDCGAFVSDGASSSGALMALGDIGTSVVEVSDMAVPM